MQKFISKLIVAILVLHHTSVSYSQKKSAIIFKSDFHHEYHIFSVDFGPPSTRGDHKDQNTTFGLGINYNKELSKCFSTTLGINFLNYKSKIKRVYDRKFWNDLTAILNYTDKTKYNFLSLPIGFDYLIKTDNRLRILVGTNLNFNFSFSQKYGVKNVQIDKINRFYFLGFSNQISIAFQKKLSQKTFLEFRPYLYTFERWKKDRILFENQNEYHNLGLNALGFYMSLGINF